MTNLEQAIKRVRSPEWQKEKWKQWEDRSEDESDNRGARWGRYVAEQVLFELGLACKKDADANRKEWESKYPQFDGKNWGGYFVGKDDVLVSFWRATLPTHSLLARGSDKKEEEKK